MAKVYFNQVYKGTGSAYTISSSSIAITTPLAGSSFSFTSANPNDANFIANGNNVSGTLSYVNGSGAVVSITGVISRQEKAGANTRAYYFVADGTGEAYLMPEPADQGAFTGNQTIGTDSSPFLTDLNNFLNAQAAQPSVSVATGAASYSEGAGFAGFTVSLSAAAGTAVSFTPTLSSGTATVGTDTGNTLQFSTDGGVTWSNVVGAVTIAAGQTSVRLRVSITDDAAAEASESFTLSTGAITGGNVVNTGGAFSSATIIDNDSVDVTPPVAPVITNVTELPPDPNTADLLTNDNTQVLTVTGEAACTLTVYTAAGVLVPTATYTVTETTPGVYTVNFGNNVLADGQYTVKLTDAANNTSAASGPFTVDTTAPATVPTVAAQTTNDTTPLITGTATVAAGETLTVTVNGVTYTAGDGRLSLAGTNWSLQIPDSQAIGAGSYAVTATVTDGAGNATSDATTSELTIDTAVTAGPLDMTNPTDSGVSQDDQITANGLPVLTFPGEAGLTLNLRGPDGTVLTAGTHYSVAYAGGVYTVTLLDAQPGGAANPFGTFSGGVANGNPAATSDGVYTIGATDTAGNTANVGTFTIDTTRPSVVPTVTSQSTNDTTPLIRGTATVGAGETLTVSVNGVTYTAGDGRLSLTGTSWSLQVPDAQAILAGTYPVTATVTDTAGNAVSDATTSELLIDTTLTAGPLDMTDPTDSGYSADDRVTANGLPVLTFPGEPGLTLTLRGPDGTLLTPGTHYSVAYVAGTYRVTLLDAQPGGVANPFGTYNSGYGFNGNPAATADGTYTIGATDPYGNTGVVGNFVIDTTPPAVPGVNPQWTNDTTPVITGTAVMAPGDTLSVTVNGVTYTADQGLFVNGSTWSLQIPDSRAMAAGTYAVTAAVTDLAGNVSLDVTAGELVVDLGLTAGPLDMTNATDSGISPDDQLTSNGLPVLTFPGEPGLTLTLKGPDGTTLTAGTHYSVAYAGGVYTVTLLDAQPGGAANPFGTFSGGAVTGNPAATADGTYTISARDPAGNSGTVGTFVIDTTPPAVAPTVTAQTTTDNTPVITGTATVAAGETFTVTVNGVTYSVGDGRLSLSGGSWSLQIPDDQALAAATYSVTARVTDAAGNAKPDATASELVIQQSVKRITPQDAGSGANDPGDSTVTEGGTLRFAVELNAPGLVPTTMPLALSGTTSAADLGALRFTDGVTYDPSTGLITIPAGVSAFAIEVPTVDDPLVEPVETANLTLAGVSGIGTVVDNDQQSVTRVTPEDALNSGAADGDSAVVEGQALRYTVNLSAPSATPTRLSLTIAGTANAADRAALSFSDGVTLDPATGELIVPAGVTSFSVTVPTVDDSIVEGAETVTLTVGGVPGTGTIIDNEAQTVARVAAQDPMNPLAVQPDQQVMEGQPLEFSVSLSNASTVASTFPLSIGGTAAGIDVGLLTFSDGVTYNPTTGTVTVPAGVVNFRITVPTVDDTQVELTESVILSVGGLSSVGLITDNDRLSVARITPEDAGNAAGSGRDAVVEEGGVLRFSVALSGSSPATSTFPLSLGGTASEADLSKLSFSDGVTYDPATGLLTVPAGVAGFAITLPTQDDSRVESTESVRLNLGGLTATGLITDNDTPSIARVTAEDAAQAGQPQADPAVVEGQTLRFSVAISQVPVKPVTFPLGISGSASGLDLGNMSFTDGVTYEPATGLITVPAGVGSFNLMLATVDDTVVEPAEDVRVNIGGVPALGVITDNDQPSVTQVTAEDNANLNAPATDAGVIEGQTLRFNVQLSAASPVAYSLPIALGGTAIAADLGTMSFTDGVRLDAATGRLLIPAGVSSFAVLLPTVDDKAVESTETASLNIGGVTATGTISDNDAPAVARVVAEDASNTGADAPDAAVVEGQSLRFSVALTEATQRETRIPMAWSGSAIAADLGTLAFTDGVRVDSATGELVVPAGVSSFSIVVPTVDDTRVEGTETVNLNVGGLSATGTILDNDVLFVASVVARDPQAGAGTAADPAVVEGQSLQFGITLSQAPAVQTQLPFSWSGSANAADLGALSFSDGVTYDARTGLLTVPAGVSKFTVSVATVDDRVVESSESVSLSVGGLIASGTILDNDRPAVRSVQAYDAAPPSVGSVGSIQDTTVEEGQPLRYTISLDAAAATPLSLPFSLSGTASSADYGTLNFTNGVKYDPVTGLISVPAGVSSFDLVVQTIDDTRSEATESLIINVDGLYSVGRITDNDRPMILNARATPGAATAWIQVPENSTPVTAMSTAEPASWVISGGADAAFFALDANGNLSFKKGPDYESPSDAARRNVYELELTATDVNGNWSRQKISVEVMDVVEAVPLYAAKLTTGDRQLSTNLALSQDRAKTQGSSVDIDFYVMPNQTPGTVPLKAWVNLLTGDLFYAPDGTAAPYACYVPADSTQLGFVKPVGQSGIAVHLYINSQGITQMATQALAQKLGLVGQGYQDLGPIFSSIDPSAAPAGSSPDHDSTSFNQMDAVEVIGTPGPVGP